MPTFSEYTPWGHRGANGYMNPGIARSAAGEFARIIMDERDKAGREGIAIVSVDRSSATLAVATQHALIDRGIPVDKIEWVLLDKFQTYTPRKWTPVDSLLVFIDDYLCGGNGFRFADENTEKPIDLALYIKVPNGYLRETYTLIPCPIQYLDMSTPYG